MKRFEYVCTTCGRAFGRRFVAKRHLTNVHKAEGAITSVMDYMLGVIKGSYPWPSLPQNGNQFKNRKNSPINFVREYQDKIHELAQFGRDFRELWGQKYAVNRQDTPQPPPPLLLVGYLCDKCRVHGVFPLINLNEYVPIDQRHDCKHDLITPLADTGGKDHLQERFDEFQNLVKAVVENWVHGEKYLYAIQIQSDHLQSIFPHIRKFDMKLSDLKKYADEMNQQHHYVQRAIEAAEKNGWTTISDVELLNLIGNAGATGAVYTITGDERSSPTGSYLVSIVPPHMIDAKKRNDELIRLMKEVGL